MNRGGKTMTITGLRRITLLGITAAFLGCSGGGSDAPVTPAPDPPPPPTAAMWFENPTLLFEDETGGPSDSGLFNINDDRVLQWAIADLTGDGLDDVIATFPGYDSADGVRNARPIRIFAQAGDATLTEVTSSLIVGQIPATEFTRHIITADFNGDGLADIFLLNHGLELPTSDPGADWHEPDVLLLSNVDGNYEDKSVNIPGLNDYYSHGGAVGDIDGDSDVDILVNVNNWPPVGIVVYVNDGTGNFTLGADLIPMWDYWGLVAPVTGDLWIELLDADGDGDLDLFIAGNVPAKHYVAINDGTGRFNVQSPVSLPDPIWPFIEGALVSDLDGDGLDDLVLVNTDTSAEPWDHQLQILMSAGDGSFGDETTTRLPSPAGETTNPHIVEADLNGDGLSEILNVIGQSSTSVVDFYANDGMGVFTRIGPGFLDELPHSYTPIDLDNDGDIDFVASGWVESLGVSGFVVYEALTKPDF